MWNARRAPYFGEQALSACRPRCFTTHRLCVHLCRSVAGSVWDFFLLPLPCALSARAVLLVARRVSGVDCVLCGHDLGINMNANMRSSITKCARVHY